MTEQRTPYQVKASLPSWVVKLSQRIAALESGRYQVILTVGDKPDWTVVQLGKVEQSSRPEYTTR